MKVGSIFISPKEFQFDFVRSPGAGGQNVNKVNSKAVLRWNVEDSPSISEALRQRFLDRWSRRINQDGEVLVTSSRYRDQLKNKQDALDKLVAMLEEVKTPPKPRKKTKPSKAAKERRLREKKQRSETKSRRKSLSYDS
ncbi:MAG: alternative ribosome rescue aminoacyl-tRNA hydrolase ArfB [Oligoflexales bacterium]